MKWNYVVLVIFAMAFIAYMATLYHPWELVFRIEMDDNTLEALKIVNSTGAYT